MNLVDGGAGGRPTPGGGLPTPAVASTPGGDALDGGDGGGNAR